MKLRELGLASFTLILLGKTGPITQLCFRGNSLFFGGGAGIIWYSDDRHCCTELYKVGAGAGAGVSLASLASLAFLCILGDRLVLLTRGGVLVSLLLEYDGNSKPKIKGENKLKLSSGPHTEKWLSGVSINDSNSNTFILATVSNESLIRFWSIEEEESSLLSLSEVDESLRGDKALCLYYNSILKLSAVGTNQGRVLWWRRNNGGDWEHVSSRCLGTDNPDQSITSVQ